MDGSQITLSKDNALNSYSTFKEDGTTPAIGTDYNGITKITVDFDGAKCSIVSLDKIVDDLEAQVPTNTVKSNQVLVQNALSKLEIKVGGLTVSGKGETGKDYPNDVNVEYVVDEYQETLGIDYPATTTVITLLDTSSLLAGMQLRVEDSLNATNFENVTIGSVDSATQITITALVNSYTTANGAVIYRTFTPSADKTYDFNGTTSHADSGSDTAFDLATIYCKIDKQSSDGVIFDFGSGARKLEFLTDNIRLVGDGGVWFYDTNNTFANGIHEIIARWTGSAYEIIVDGVNEPLSLTGSPVLLQSAVLIALGYQDSSGDKFLQMDLYDLVASSQTITLQNAIDITDGTVELSSLLNDTNSEVIYNPDLVTTVLTIPNFGSVPTEWILTPTAIVLTTVTLSDFINTSKIVKTTANKGVAQNGLVFALKYNNDGVDPDVEVAISFSNDNVESYVDLVEQTDLEYIDGSDIVKTYFFNETVTAGTNIFIKITVIKDSINDVQTSLQEYGNLIKT
jgi:hypothetical protein